jgi:tetratricopeptide (TPR) repeat protein
MRHTFLLAIATTLFLVSMGATAEAQDRESRQVAQSLAMSGRKLTAEDVESLEKQSDQNPNDVTSRTKLLGYYFLKQYQNPSAREARQKHVLWLIRNSPDSEVLGIPEGTLDSILDPEAYLEGKKAWIDQLKREPENLKRLDHSAAFFLQRDRELAIESLKKARSLDMENPKWPDKLGHVYALNMIGNSLKSRTDAAGKALEQFEIAYKLSTDSGRDPLLQYLAKVALAANNLDKAKEYAKKMLSQSGSGWNSGNNIHHGNIILGQIALRSGKIDEAKEHLIKAGQTPGSPQLNSFGPNMTLARELLEKHQKDVVLEYFALCSKFWRMHRDRLEKWSAVVKEGNIPDFGGNLNY